MEVIDYSDDDNIPFCDGTTDDKEDLIEELNKVVFASGNKKQKQEIKEKEDDQTEADLTDKPKVGHEYRYRVSKMLAAKGLESAKPKLEEPSKKESKKKSEKSKKTKKEEEPTAESDKDEYDPSKKPKVGYEYRYRVSRLLADKANNKNEPKQQQIKKKATSTPKKIEPIEDESKYSPENKPKVGYEYRYRVSKMLADPKHETPKPKIKETKKVTKEEKKKKPKR